MGSIPVVVKHQGKKYDVELDPNALGEVFKFQLYSLTGVEPHRQKILVKGGQLKDETELSKIGAKPGQMFMMMGTPEDGETLQRPKETIKFIEDMTEVEVAQQDGATPAGLQNLGNTCYLSSTLQTLRVIPELQQQLKNYTTASDSSFPNSSLGNISALGLAGLGTSSDLVASLRDLYKQMGETQVGFPPLAFLNSLRTIFPQFAEKSKSGNGYAQQDAEEAWSQILNQLREKLRITVQENGDSKDVSFVDRYMRGEFTSITECDEQAAKEAGEMPTQNSEPFLKLDCHISASTNHLRDGILAGLEQKLEKQSPLLCRNTVYTKKMQISKLPKYLTVHFVRFYWKRDAQKKAKIMRKVTFPDELDVVEFCTDELKHALIPVRDKVREVRKDEEDFERARKRQKVIKDKQIADVKAGIVDSTSTNVQDGSKGVSGQKNTETDTEMKDVVNNPETDAERAASILAAKKELHAMVNIETLADDSINKSGLYELRGIVTHQGASADSGHYTSYVKKQGPLDSKTGQRGEEDGKWWWFNDDKVSEVEAEKIKTLSGGGESHSALILLYRAIPLPDAAGISQG
ncbi:Ubiquitin-specific protease [Blumeria graminis f. sp. tritici 96224]|uniref:Ubiquitin carboxyl-terminal hydrolase n=2 Tax=Blumeria graminis f. sp. tritici TaxID=62690 RepID=A0A381LFJ3_BLUGR|nr:Ubiquitin-specific protease [Blumeria graminis f. sp. tritici 96224]